MNNETKNKRVALKALEKYSFNVKNVEFLIEETNVFFLVHTDTEKVVLKIFQEESSKIEDNLVEVYFMEQITDNTDILIPEVVVNNDGDKVFFVYNDDFKMPKRVAVYKFLEGEDFNEIETDELFYKLGKVIAKLHNMSKELVIPKELEPKKWDDVFYYRDEYAMYNETRFHKFICKEDRELLDEFIPFLNRELMKLYQEPTYLIHADLNPWNIKVHNNEIRLLDFEEGMVGNIIHEMAILIFYYRYDKNYDYKKIKKQVFAGYEEITKLPEISDFVIDMLIMARTVNFVNYVLILYDDPTEYIKNRMIRIREFLSSYKVAL